MREPASPPPVAPPSTPRIHKVLFWAAVAAWVGVYLVKTLMLNAIAPALGLARADWQSLFIVVIVSFVLNILSAIPANVAALYPLFRRDLRSDKWVIVAWVISILAALFFDVAFCASVPSLLLWIGMSPYF